MQNTRSIRRNGRRYHLPLRGRREKVYPCGFLRLLGRGRIHGTGEQRNDSEDAESKLKRVRENRECAAVCAWQSQAVQRDAALRRALVAVNCAFRAVCFRNPPRLLRSVSSSQKVLRALCPRSIATRFFLGALLFLCFSVGSVVATCACIGGAQRRHLYQDKHTSHSHYRNSSVNQGYIRGYSNSRLFSTFIFPISNLISKP